MIVAREFAQAEEITSPGNEIATWMFVYFVNAVTMKLTASLIV